MDLEKLRQKLREYRREDIEFNEPHFTQQLWLREGNRQEVIQNLLDPKKLRDFSKEVGKYGDIKYTLLFEMSNTRTMKLPVIFDRHGERNLYIITYILTYRPWQSIIRRRKRR